MKDILLISMLILTVSSCKYEDGPKLSLRTKKHRVVNTWILEKAFENGADKTSEYKNAFVDYRIELKDNNKYQLSYKAFNLLPYTESGEWSFINNKENISFTPEGKSTNPASWKILRLKEHETRVIQAIDGKDVELWLKD